MDTLITIHDRLSTTVILFMFAIGLWGIFTFVRGGVLGGSIAGAMIIGQILITIEVILGAIIFADGFRPESNIHYLYGATALIVMPFAYSYLQRRDPRQALLFFSIAALFIGGIAIRSITTG